MAQELALCWDRYERLVSSLSPHSGDWRFRLRTGMASADHSAFFKVAHYQSVEQIAASHKQCYTAYAMISRRRFLITAGATLACGPSLLAAQANEAGGRKNLSPSSRLLLFGTDYYPDQTPESLWQQDVVAMAQMGITNVRLAEFAWALLEPQEGSFDFSWLQRCIKLLNEHGIATIIGTPSAAPPPWLTQKFPEVLMVNDHGQTLNPRSEERRV